MAFHGTKDPLVPYQNGAVGLSLPGIRVRGTERNMSDWARLDHCRSVPIAERLGSQVHRQQWTDCVHGTSVELYSIIGGGHSWPGADPSQAVGLTTQQVSATKQILMFFDRG
jgi:polyhydroxybutyrate depolymerase